MMYVASLVENVETFVKNASHQFLPMDILSDHFNQKRPFNYWVDTWAYPTKCYILHSPCHIWEAVLFCHDDVIKWRRWVNNRDVGDLRCHRAHNDVIIMVTPKFKMSQMWIKIMMSNIHICILRLASQQSIYSFTYVYIYQILLDKTMIVFPSPVSNI